MAHIWLQLRQASLFCLFPDVFRFTYVLNKHGDDGTLSNTMAKEKKSWIASLTFNYFRHLFRPLSSFSLWTLFSLYLYCLHQGNWSLQHSYMKESGKPHWHDHQIIISSWRFSPSFFPFRKTSLEMRVTAVEYWPFVTSSIRPPDRLAVFWWFWIQQCSHNEVLCEDLKWTKEQLD